MNDLLSLEKLKELKELLLNAVEELIARRLAEQALYERRQQLGSEHLRPEATRPQGAEHKAMRMRTSADGTTERIDPN